MSAETTAAAPRITSGRTAGPAKIGIWGPPVLVFAGVLGLWYAISASLGQRSFILPPPHQVLAVFLRDSTRSEIFAGLGVTLQTTLFGLLLAAVIGIVWAIAMSQAKWIERSTCRRRPAGSC